MGRIKTARIKRAANTTIKSFKDKLTTNFEANKKLVDELIQGKVDPNAL